MDSARRIGDLRGARSGSLTRDAGLFSLFVMRLWAEGQKLKLGWPFSHSVKDSQDFYRIAPYSVWNNIRRTANHELTRARHSSRPAEGWMTGEPVNR
jgi:hypothetical protein